MALDENAPLFVISVAAELSGMHPQTLRTYDRLGLVRPQRAAGRGRRYSTRDVAQLRLVQQLSQEEGVSLAGIKRILSLQDELAATWRALRESEERVAQLEAAVGRSGRVFATASDGRTEVFRRGERPNRHEGALVVWRPRR